MSTPVVDTDSTTITGKDGTADFTWDDGNNVYSLACTLDSFRVREVIEMTNADTFCIEGQADQEPGRSQLQFELTGLGRKGGLNSTNLMGNSKIQGALVTMTVSTGCTIDFPNGVNFVECSIDRVVNANTRIAARGLSKGTYTVTWKTSTP